MTSSSTISRPSSADTRLRLSRPCYDKPWRCPGWAGGGMRYPKADRCESGSISMWNDPSRFVRFRFGRCTQCGVVTLPWVTRHLDPTHWKFAVRSAWREVKWRIESRRF